MGDDVAPDEVSVTSSAGGDDRDFVLLLRHELPRIQRVARLLVSDPDVAEDLVAEAVARSLPRWRAGAIDDGGAYLRRVVVNLASRRWRRRTMAATRDRHAANWSAPTAGDDSMVTERDQTLRAIRALPPRRRSVVVLRFYDDLTEARIADVLP
jgi:DNA-directed RNA polymerase specialized sigma24 family protein